MVEEATGNARLLKLAAFLRTLPSRRFDYYSWVGADWTGRPDLSCGTRACALGWATTMPAFRRLGLRLVRDTHEVELKGRSHSSQVWRSIAAAMVVFALSEGDASYVFMPQPGDVNTPKYVARKIERFVREREKGNG